MHDHVLHPYFYTIILSMFWLVLKIAMFTTEYTGQTHWILKNIKIYPQPPTFSFQITPLWNLPVSPFQFWYRRLYVKGDIFTQGGTPKQEDGKKAHVN